MTSQMMQNDLIMHDITWHHKQWTVTRYRITTPLSGPQPNPHQYMPSWGQVRTLFSLESNTSSPFCCCTFPVACRRLASSLFCESQQSRYAAHHRAGHMYITIHIRTYREPTHTATSDTLLRTSTAYVATRINP